MQQAELSADRQELKLTFRVESHPLGMVHGVSLGKLIGESGNALTHDQAWYTDHNIPD